MESRSGNSTPPVVAVAGAGTMGRGIAQLAALAGKKVLLYDPFASALEHARTDLGDIFAMLEGRGRLTEPAATLLERIRFVSNLSAVAGAGWILEAAPEDLDLKKRLFRELERAAPEAVLATNTSTLSVTRIASAVERPSHVVGMHFFNPAPLMRLVEVIPGADTGAELVTQALALATALGKTPVIARDRPGFIVNRVARPFYGEALRLAGEGLEIDVMDRIVRGLGFRMGPFELLDLIGLDVNLAATRSVFEAFFFEPRYRPHPLQAAMVAAGRLGRKSGRGFYRYPRPESPRSAEVATLPAGDPPKALILGRGTLAEALKVRLDDFAPDEAELVLDARVALQEKAQAPLERDLPVVTLTWGHSASAAQRHFDQPAAGFSLIPPLADGAIAELFAPLSGSNRALELAHRLFRGHGLATVTLPDQPGGVGFRLVALLVNEAAGAVAEHLASPADIDTAMRLGSNYPRGPLEWSERIGFEELLAGLEGLHQELGGERYSPHPLLKRLVAAGVAGWTR